MTQDLSAETQENSLALQILPLDKIRPHEQIDPVRVQRLAVRFKSEKILKNPPLVMPCEDGQYVVLDGATRITALKKLGLKYVAVQVVSQTRRDLVAQSWNHVLRGISAENLLDLIEKLPEVSYVPVEVNHIQDGMVELGGLCYLVLPNRQAFVVQPVPGGNRLDAVNKLVESYISASNVSRTLAGTFNEAQVEFPDIAGLIIFPTFTVEQILQISSVGKVVPAGITRLLIPGRVLRLNLDFDRLAKNEPQSLKSSWLNQVVLNLTTDRKIRYYQEPVYLLDE